MAIDRFPAMMLAVLVLSGASPPAAAIDAKEILSYRELGDVQISPDGRRIVFVANENDLERNIVRANLWLVDVPGERTLQLTTAVERASEPAWSPDGARIAFLTNRAGSDQIWTISPDGGEAHPAVPAEQLRITRFRWLPDGSGFLFVAAASPVRRSTETGMARPGAGLRPEPPPAKAIVVDADPVYARLYRYAATGKRPQALTPEDYHVVDFDVAADGRYVVLTGQARPGPEYSLPSDLKMLDLSSRDTRVLSTQRVPFVSPRFSPDGSQIAFISHVDRNDGTYNALTNAYLQTVRADGTNRRVISREADANVLGFHWAPAGEALYFWVHEGVSSRVYRQSTASTSAETLKAFAGGWAFERNEGASFSKDGRTGAAVVSNGATPAEVYLLTDSGQGLRRLTDLNRGFAELAPQTELMNYRSGDGRDLEALVVLPKGFRSGQRYPLLVVVHGGPPLVFTDSFAPRRSVYPIFAFSDSGYLLLLPNPRGSTGYGEKFRQANIRDTGGGDFRDIMAGVDRLIERGFADPERLGLMGWSYGGYMSYWALTHTDRFKAISAGAAISNMTSQHGISASKGYELFDSLLGVTPWEDPQLYVERSSLFFIEKAKTPLLIQHGDKDPAIPLSQGEELYAAAKRVGLPVEMVIYPGQSHVIQAPLLVLDAMQRNLDWFNRWLSGGAAAAATESAGPGGGSP